MVVTGNTLKKSRVAVSLSKTRPGFLYAAVGVHPHWSKKDWNDSILKVSGSGKRLWVKICVQL